VEKGDIIAVAGGLFIVLVIALVVNSPLLAGIRGPLSGESQGTATEPPPPLSLSTVSATTEQKTTPVITPSASATPVLPARISYSDKPFSYPVVRLPERLDVYGESDILRKGEDTVTFAYMEEYRGGLSRVFSIPYPVWSMDIRVIDNTTPNIASFRMALCYAANGTIIDGVEMIHPGTAYKKVQTSNTPLYLIISLTNIEKYRIEFQTSREYYDQFGIQKYETVAQ
jgi:hypothetical protein